MPYDKTFNVLASLLLSKVATLIQSNSLSGILPYIYVPGQDIGLAVFAA